MEINCKITTAFIINLSLLYVNEAFKLQPHNTEEIFLKCDIIESNLNTNKISDVLNLPIHLLTIIKCVPKGILTNEELMKTITDFRSQNDDYNFKVLLYDTKDGQIIHDGKIVEKEIYRSIAHISINYGIIFTIPADQESKVREILKSIEYKLLAGKRQINETIPQYYDSNAVPPEVTDSATFKIISNLTDPIISENHTKETSANTQSNNPRTKMRITAKVTRPSIIVNTEVGTTPEIPITQETTVVTETTLYPKTTIIPETTVAEQTTSTSEPGTTKIVTAQATSAAESTELSTIDAVNAEIIVITESISGTDVNEEVKDAPITELPEYVSTDVTEDVRVKLLPVNKLKATATAKEGVPFYTLPIFIAVTSIASFIIAVIIVTLCLYHLYAPKIDSPDGGNANGPELVNVRVKTIEHLNENNSVNNLNSIDDSV